MAFESDFMSSNQWRLNNNKINLKYKIFKIKCFLYCTNILLFYYIVIFVLEIKISKESWVANHSVGKRN